MLFYKNKPINVQLPTDSCVSAEIAGTISLTPNITLLNVLFLPNFSLNLIYVFKLCHHSNCIVFFFGSQCLIQDSMSKRMIGMAKQKDGLYKLLVDAKHTKVHSVYINNVFLFLSQLFDILG